jgi:nuclear pore complex protein Nup205
VYTRYHQVFMPVMRLVTSVLCSIGPENQVVASRVGSFLSAHREVLISILRDANASVTTSSLEQVEVISCLLSQLSQRPQAFDLVHHVTCSHLV